MIDFGALIARNLDNKVGGVEPVQLALWNLKREGVLCPRTVRDLDLLLDERVALVSGVQSDGDACISAQMAGIETAQIIAGAMNGKIDLLLDPGVPSWHTEDPQRLPGVGRIAIVNFVAISLMLVERLPRQWQCQIARRGKFRVVMQHGGNPRRTPQTRLQAGVLQ